MISIVIPAYNAQRWIAECVRSCLDQVVDRQIEVLVIDDASTDDTAVIVERIGRQDGRVRCLRFDRNRGPSAGRNAGIENARGDYIALLDSDDLMLPGRLTMQLERMTSTSDGCVICCSWTREESSTGDLIRTNRFSTERQGERLVRDIFLGRVSAITPTLFFKRTDAMAVEGFDESLRYREDSDFLLKVLQRGGLTTVAVPLVVRRVHSDGMSNRVDSVSFLDSRERFAASAVSMYPFLKKDLALFWARSYYILARKRSGGDRAEVRSLLYRSIRYRPTPRAFAALALSFLPLPRTETET